MNRHDSAFRLTLADLLIGILEASLDWEDECGPVVAVPRIGVPAVLEAGRR